MTRTPSGWDVESPVQAEVFVVWRDDDHLELSGPCGAAPWIIELAPADHPVEVVDRIVRDVIGPPLLVHSTSWRRDREAVILSFVVIVDRELVKGMDTHPISRAELARSATTAAPRSIAIEAVVEHGLRHMAWLVEEDAVVAGALDARWHALLSGYVPEPFRALG
jgi:hypothetical protein